MKSSPALPYHPVSKHSPASTAVNRKGLTYCQLKIKIKRKNLQIN